MSERSEMPRDLARRMTQRKQASLRSTAEYYAQRAKWQTSPSERERLTQAAEHYRELAELEEEVAKMRPKPPTPSA
jgi:hypothetical protein